MMVHELRNSSSSVIVTVLIFVRKKKGNLRCTRLLALRRLWEGRLSYSAFPLLFAERLSPWLEPVTFQFVRRKLVDKFKTNCLHMHVDMGYEIIYVDSSLNFYRSYFRHCKQLWLVFKQINSLFLPRRGLYGSHIHLIICSSCTFYLFYPICSWS